MDVFKEKYGDPQIYDSLRSKWEKAKGSGTYGRSLVDLEQ